jgi:protein-S-isoprenylcysteine O-methyltransferase Ste14
VHPRSGELAVRGLAARIAYAGLFCAVLPVLLVLWARATADVVTLPAYGSPALAFLPAIAGGLLLAAGMYSLWRHGGGLPMNAFPPPRLVTRGIYWAIPHPIYTGFCLMSVAAAMAAGSGSGLWLVCPVLALGCASLVWGYERPDLERRFGAAKHPGPPEWVRYYLFALLPWLVLYEIGASLGVTALSWDTSLPLDAQLPVWPWTEAVYASIYLAALLAPVLAGRGLRILTTRTWIAMAVVFSIYFCFPSFAPRHEFTGDGVWAGLLRWERALDPPSQALPSFHAIWALLIAAAIGGWPARVWAILVCLSCVTTGAHTVTDVVGGAAVALLVMRAPQVWERLRAAAESMANSWCEWRLGPIRIINHGAYGGAGAFMVVAIAGSLMGPGHVGMLVATSVAALAGAGLWAQLVEGLPRLLRPFGFYGGLFAVIAVSLLSSAPILIMAAYCVGAPWLQSLGRLRCLVQGCCHGRPASPEVGIRYVHARSRVCRLAGLKGVPLHPTQLYSILWNVAIAMVMTRLWVVHAPVGLIGGLYLILTGIGRFSEEAYRGEPQTPILAGLRLYQWIAIGTVVGGAAITALAPSGPAPAASFSWEVLGIAAGFGAISTVLLGVDAPESDRRFARLT